MSEQRYGERMREHLKAMLGPLADEYAQLGEREQELAREIEEVRQARRDAIVVLRRIDPERYADNKPGPKKRSMARRGTVAADLVANSISEANLERVRVWLDAHANNLPDEWQAQVLVDAIRNGSADAPGKDTVRRAIRVLHGRGFLTATRHGGGGKGGGQYYALTREVGKR